MKVIFLDFDGVLNYPSIWGKYRGRLEEALCPILTTKVGQLAAECDAKVVISSTWRKSFDLQELSSFLILKGFTDADSRVIGITPDLGYQHHRQDEILLWLAGHPEVTEFVILDDDTAEDRRWEKAAGAFVKINDQTGITDADIEKARAILLGGVK
jgi:hypothetical protein